MPKLETKMCAYALSRQFHSEDRGTSHQCFSSSPRWIAMMTWVFWRGGGTEATKMVFTRKSGAAALTSLTSGCRPTAAPWAMDSVGSLHLFSAQVHRIQCIFMPNSFYYCNEVSSKRAVAQHLNEYCAACRIQKQLLTAKFVYLRSAKPTYLHLSTLFIDFIPVISQPFISI